MPNDNSRKCDECGIKLHGECIVDGALLLCYDCAEDLDYEREMNDVCDGTSSDYSERMSERRQMGLCNY